ncbi:hypothetical protein [Nonomuraea wenchangensis]
MPDFIPVLGYANEVIVIAVLLPWSAAPALAGLDQAPTTT